MFLDILHKMKENLGQQHVKASILQGTKLKQFSLLSLEKLSFFQFWLYFSTHPSLNSDFLTLTEIIFLKQAIIGLFARKVSQCYLEDCEFGSNLNYWYFRLKSSDVPPKHLSFEELLW